MYEIDSLFENMPKNRCSEHKCNHDFTVTEVTCTNNNGKTARYAFEVKNLNAKSQKNEKPVVTVEKNTNLTGTITPSSFNKCSEASPCPSRKKVIIKVVAAKAKQVMPKKGEEEVKVAAASALEIFKSAVVVSKNAEVMSYYTEAVVKNDDLLAIILVSEHRHMRIGGPIL